MKLLTAGHGAGDGPNMVLTCESRVVPSNLEEILLSYSCHAPALPKIRQCLEMSGRYDAWIQPGWIFSQHQSVKRDLQKIGIRLRITSVPSLYEAQAKRSGLQIETINATEGAAT